MRVLLVAVAALLIVAVDPARATEPRTNLADVEDEVMCPICGTVLEHSQAPQADRERALIRRLVDEGRTKDEIKDVLVAEYGREVLASPDRAGFDLAAWLVPAMALIACGAAIAMGVARASRSNRQGEVPPAVLDAGDSRRLDRDMARHDS